MTYANWQLDQLGCECPIHRYHVAHLCTCGKVISHSQADWDAHRDHDMMNFDPTLYKHGDTFRDVFDTLHIRGLIPFGSAANLGERLYAIVAEAE